MENEEQGSGLSRELSHTASAVTSGQPQPWEPILTPAQMADILRREWAIKTELLGALKPFAETGAVLDTKPKDGAVWAGQTPAPPITFGHLRAAYAAIHAEMLARPSLNGRRDAPTPADHDLSGRQGNTSVAHAPRDTPKPSSPPEDERSKLSGGWEPIETCPRDPDMLVDLWADGGRWPDHHWSEAHQEWACGSWKYDRKSKNTYRSNIIRLNFKPTHWMRPPGPPALPQDHATVRGREDSVDLQTNVDPHCADSQASPTRSEP